MKLDFDVAIIGAGVAGMTSAIYLKRAGISCCLIEKDMYGGQINKASKVANYPGYVEISGIDLSMNIFKQIENLKIKYINKEVIDIDLTSDIKTIKLRDGNTVTSKLIIIATGRSPRKIGIDNITSFEGRGISYCATCDGNFFKDEDVAVIGGGSTALEEALYLSKICKKVNIIVRSDKLRAERYYIEEAEKCSNINVIYNREVQSINDSEGVLNSITLKDKHNNIAEKMSVKGCFICIGYIPNSDLFNNLEKEDSYILVNENQETNVDGIYAIGDVTKKSVNQLLTAMNDGVIAANSCIKKIDDSKKI